MTREEREAQYQRWQEAPVFSCCSVGPGRWYWIVISSHRAACDGAEPLFTGYAVSREAAAEAIRNAYGSFTEWDRNMWAEGCHRRQAVDKRRQRRSQSTESAPVEFVYHGHFSDYTNDYHWTKHQIIRKTAKRVYVDDLEYQDPDALVRNTGGRRDGYDVRTFVLDREELERDGRAYSRSWRSSGYYYLKPELAARMGTVPPCLERLGLAPPATAAAVKSAYRRLSRELHPDQGGDHERFIEIQQAYEQALRLCEAVGHAASR